MDLQAFLIVTILLFNLIRPYASFCSHCTLDGSMTYREIPPIVVKSKTNSDICYVILLKFAFFYPTWIGVHFMRIIHQVVGDIFGILF